MKLVAAGKSDKPDAMMHATRYLGTLARNRMPRLIALTDPTRAPDPFAALAAVPHGSILIWRAYGIDISRSELARLSRAARAKHCLLFLSGSNRTARPGIDGIHLAEHMLNTPHTDGMLVGARRSRPGLLVTAAAHSQSAILAAARAGADAVLISPVFATASHPGARTLGVTRFAQLAHFALSLGLSVYALGGVTTPDKLRRLRGSGASGVAGIGFLTR